jgi:hypothetical protein
MHIHSINVPINRTTETLLFGSPKLAPNQNVELFLAVQTFAIVSDLHIKFLFRFFVFFFFCALLFHHLVFLYEHFHIIYPEYIVYYHLKFDISV